MTQRAIGAVTLVAVLASAVPLTAQTPGMSRPSYRTVAQCVAAYERERALAKEANAKLTSARLFSAEEAEAMAEQNRHSAQANLIDQVCNEMKRDERPLADQVKELTGLLDGLGPTGGSMRTPVAGAIRQRNLTKAGEELEQLGGTLDQALAEFRASDFGRTQAGGSAPPRLRGNPDPALGAQAAQSLRADLDQWKAAEAERQRRAAIEAARQRQLQAERERIALAQAAEQRAYIAAQEEERRSRNSSFWGTLGTLAGIGLGIATARRGGGVSTAPLQNYANAQALANAGRSTGPVSTPSGSSCGLTSSDFNPEPPSSGNICQDARAHVAWLQREQGRARSCGNAQLTQYHQQTLADAQSYAASVCG